jgi:hypothetical protein
MSVKIVGELFIYIHICIYIYIPIRICMYDEDICTLEIILCIIYVCMGVCVCVYTHICIYIQSRKSQNTVDAQ